MIQEQLVCYREVARGSKLNQREKVGRLKPPQPPLLLRPCMSNAFARLNTPRLHLYTDVTNWWAWTGSSNYLQTARLASLLASKRDKPYSTTMGWLRCKLSFTLLRSSILCIRGTRSSGGHSIREPPLVDLISSEVQLSTSSA